MTVSRIFAAFLAFAACTPMNPAVAGGADSAVLDVAADAGSDAAAVDAGAEILVNDIAKADVKDAGESCTHPVAAADPVMLAMAQDVTAVEKYAKAEYCAKQDGKVFAGKCAGGDFAVAASAFAGTLTEQWYFEPTGKLVGYRSQQPGEGKCAATYYGAYPACADVQTPAAGAVSLCDAVSGTGP